MTAFKEISRNRVHGGQQIRFEHHSAVLNCDMIFGVFLPPQAETGPVPVLYWLSGLTCNDENFAQKAGAQRLASELGLAIVCPDTSPRGTDLAGEHDHWDFGSGAGFYINATQAPWCNHSICTTMSAGNYPHWSKKNFLLAISAASADTPWEGMAP